MPIEFTDDDVNNTPPFDKEEALKNEENTVNVVEVIDENISITSFKENDEGNDSAERLFAHMAKENGAKAQNLISHIEDGIFETGTYKVLLIHSNC